MNERQLMAFDNPCVVAEQCVDERFHKDLMRPTLKGKVPFSTLLTFNFGME